MKTELSTRKMLKKSPRETIAKLIAEQSNAGIRESLNRLGDELDELLKLKNTSSEDQKRKSRQIGIAKTQQSDITSLLSEMNLISVKLKQTNSRIEAILDEIETNSASTSSEATSTNNVEIQKSRPAHFYSQAISCNADELDLELIEHCSSSEWIDYTAQHLQATIYHDIKWFKLIENNFNHKSYCLAARDPHGQIRGVLSLVHLKSALFGSFLVSMPYFNYGGPLADSQFIAEQLLQKSGNLAKKLACSHVEVRESNARAEWPVRKEKVSMTLCIPDTKEMLLAQFGAKLRAQVKRPLRYNASVAFGTTDLLDEFYAVFSRRMRSLGTPVYSKKFFSDILTTFPENAFIASVTVSGKPVAAGFLLGYRDTLEIPWAASFDNDKYPCINMFLYGNVLEEAQRRHYAYFDFGRSTIDGATYRFKKQWGAEPQPLFWHYWLKDGTEPPSMNPNNPKYRYAIRAWQRLPLWLTQVLGPAIVKNLP